jgi:uncharacterized protein
VHWIDVSFAGLLRVLLLVALAWLALYFYQDKLLHYPTAVSREQALAEAAASRLAPWPDAASPRAWLRSPPKARGTVILFHGNGGNALHRAWFADEMEKLGLRTLLAEYPGYGHRSGGYAERAMAADARETIALARQAFGQPLIVAGESLGAAVAAAAQDGAPAADAILLITPWATLREVAALHYPWLPLGLLLRDRYDSAAALAKFSGRQAVLLASQDSLIPAEQGRRLFAHLQGRKWLIELPGADHNDWMEYMTEAAWRDLIDLLLTGREEGKTS